MQYALLAIMDVPEIIKQFRSKYDSHKQIPAHVTLGYLKTDINQYKFNIKEIEFDTIKCVDDLIALVPRKQEIIHKKLTNIDKYIKKYPKSGFHLTLAYEKGGINDYSKVCEEIKTEITLPIILKVKEYWLMGRNDNSGWKHIKIL